MQSDLLDCPICFEQYNLTLHLPRIIPICGHTICSQCIVSLNHRDQDFTCPIGKEVLPAGTHANIDSFPPNFTLRDFIEKSLAYGLCSIHKKEFQYICTQDKVKLCNECALFGGHRNHDLRPVADLKSDVQDKIHNFEAFLQENQESQKNLEKIYEDQREETLYLAQVRFREILFLVNAKQAEFAHKINSFYDKEIERCRSLPKQIIKAKEFEYKQIIRNSESFGLLEQDYLSTLETLQDLNKTKKIEEFLQQMKLDVSSKLTSQVSALEKLLVPIEDINLVFKDIHLVSEDNLLLQNNQFDIIPQGNRLSISYPFNQNTLNNINVILQDLLKQKDQISVLQFKITQNVSVIKKKDTPILCYLRNIFPPTKIQNIEVLLNDHIICDEALLDVFSCLFWNNHSLKGINIIYNMRGFFGKSFRFIAEKVLPEIKSLERLNIYFPKSDVDGKVTSSLCQNISKLAPNLTYLQLVLNTQDAKASYIQKLFVEMPNLKFLKINLDPQVFQDELLETFVSNTLKSLTNLQEFQFILYDSKVTDLGLLKLLHSYPQEWFSGLKAFQLGFCNTIVSNKGLQGFIYHGLQHFKALERLSITISNVQQVTPSLRERIKEWSSRFSLAPNI